jgi:hypothetical protein
MVAGIETDHLSPLSAKVKNVWRYTSFPHKFCVKMNHNFISTFAYELLHPVAIHMTDI